MNKNISVKLLIPTVLIIFLAATVVGWKISSGVENEIRETAEDNVRTGIERVKETLESTNEVLSNQVGTAMKIFKEKGLRMGIPLLGGPIPVPSQNLVCAKLEIILITLKYLPLSLPVNF